MTGIKNTLIISRISSVSVSYTHLDVYKRQDQMMAGKPSLATLKTRIEDYKPAQTSAEGGVVISSA